jgi:dCMP deaminase
MRAGWDSYFIAQAGHVSTRATCDRLHVGAVLVDRNEIITTGYNGAPPDMPHCDEVGHLLIDGRCLRSIHAECNALHKAWRRRINTTGMTLYVTHSPCPDCSKDLIRGRIGRVVYAETFKGAVWEATKELLELGGVMAERWVESIS